MTLVLNGKGLLLEGSDPKIEDKQVPGIYMCVFWWIYDNFWKIDKRPRLGARSQRLWGVARSWAVTKQTSLLHRSFILSCSVQKLGHINKDWGSMRMRILKWSQTLFRSAWINVTKTERQSVENHETSQQERRWRCYGLKQGGHIRKV